ncbi:MAG: UDP-4-amino-4,6-dideoxy-N-acetyl-beta-L-altrosamine transaminase [Candidatus Izemoplasmataceae bacterium]
MGKLALFGGEPVRQSYLPYGKQKINEEDIKAVVEILHSDYLTTGPTISNFEEKIAEYVGAKYAVAVSNGTAALHMACFAAGIGPRDEVIVSGMTFAASSNCVLYQGGTPVFADIDPKTYNVSIEDIKNKITSKTKAIVAVDFTGQSVDIDEINKVAKEHNLIVIEDAAHALGSEYKNNKVGNKADLTMFSFHPVKPITTAEGGVITTSDYDLYQKMLLFRSHGITRDLDLLLKEDGPWYYEQQYLGYNYRLTDMQAALGMSQLNRLDEFINRRREIVKKYNEAFDTLKEISIPYKPKYSNSGWHLYIIRLNLELLKTDRLEIFKALQAENIGVNVHYIPVYLHPYYRDLGYEPGLCPNAEKLYNEIITLPLHPSMSDKDVSDVINAVNKVLDYYRK